MSRINGSALLLSINVADPGDAPVWRVVCGASSHTISFTSDSPSASSKCNDGHEDHISGLKSTSVTVDAMEAPDDDISFIDFFDLWEAQADVHLRCYLREGADVYLHGIATIESLEQDASMEQPVTWSATFKVKAPGLQRVPAGTLST